MMKTKKTDRGSEENKTVFNFVRTTVGAVALVILVAALAIGLNALLASHSQQTQSASQFIPPTPRTAVSQTDPIIITPSSGKPSWQTYTDEQLGFSIQYPKNWYELGTSSSQNFKGQCFRAFPEEQRDPRFCIDLEPFIQFDPKEFASAASEYQQRFFEKLTNSEDKNILIMGNQRNTVTRHYQLDGVPAIERVEETLDVEGIRPFYIVSVYVNHPQIGLTRLSMHATNREQFEQYEDVLRQILESFSFLR